MGTETDTQRSRWVLVLMGLAIVVHGLASAYLSRPAERTPQSMSDVREIQIGLVFHYLWMALGLFEVALGLLVAGNALLASVYIALVVLGVISCATLALGTGFVQIALGIGLKILTPGPQTGIRL